MIRRMGTEGERTVFTLPGKAAAVLTALLICFCGTGYADSGRAASLMTLPFPATLPSSGS